MTQTLLSRAKFKAQRLGEALWRNSITVLNFVTSTSKLVPSRLARKQTESVIEIM